MIAKPEKKPTKSQINANCQRCPLHKNAKRPCLRGRNTEKHRKLLIFTDLPDYFADHINKPYAFDVGKFLDWCLLRMSIDPKKVAFDYTLRCYTKSKDMPGSKAERTPCIEECSSYRFATVRRVRPKVIVAMGEISLEAFTGKSRIGDNEGRRARAWEPVVREVTSKLWISYGVSGVLVSAGDSPRLFRVLFKAAEEAGLKPKINLNIPPFQWRTLR